MDQKTQRAAELGVPDCYHGAALGDFTSGQIRVDGATVEPGELLCGPLAYIYGLNGRGKSHLAAAVAMLQGYYWRDWQPIVLSIGASFRPTSEQTQQGIIRRLAALPRLVLDDILRGSTHAYAMDSLVYLIEVRQRAARPTIVTAHLALDVVHGIDSHLASRLSAWTQIAVLGDDRNAKR